MNVRGVPLRHVGPVDEILQLEFHNACGFAGTIRNKEKPPSDVSSNPGRVQLVFPP
jgi:hypothetical protein